jgi:hypothetical protein
LNTGGVDVTVRGKSAFQFVGTTDLYSLFEIQDSNSKTQANDFILFAHLKINSVTHKMSLGFFVKSQAGLQAYSLTVVDKAVCGTTADCLLVGGGLFSGGYSQPFLFRFNHANSFTAPLSSQILQF